MITKQDLIEAIAECHGVRSPNANTAVKLAAFYTILDHLDDSEQSAETAIDSARSFAGYSFSDSGSVRIDSQSEFGRLIDGRPQNEIWPVIDELMSTIKVMNGRLYNGVMKKLS